MGSGTWLVTALSLLGLVLALRGVGRMIAASRIPADPEHRAKAGRRSTSGAAFALQQVFEPGIEHVVRAEQDEPGEDDDESGEGDRDDPIDTLLADLRASLGFTPVDPEEVRRILARAQREGRDWQALYEAAVRTELSERPYRAPFLPPPSKVAPRA
jgi:hypothetical protein